jgi:hypothetical protein
LAASAWLTISVEFGNVNVFGSGSAAIGTIRNNDKRNPAHLALLDTLVGPALLKRDIGAQRDDPGRLSQCCAAIGVLNSISVEF